MFPAMFKSPSGPSPRASLIFLTTAMAAVWAVVIALTQSEAQAADPRRDIPSALLSDTPTGGQPIAGTPPRNAASLREYRRTANAAAECTRRNASTHLRGVTVRTNVSESRDLFRIELGVSVRAAPGESLDAYGTADLDRLSATLSECYESTGLSRVERSYQISLMQDEEFVRRSGEMLVSCLRRAGIRNLPANVSAQEVRQDVILSVMQAPEELGNSAAVADCATMYPATLAILEP